jgi:hypothetical protein
MTPLPRFLFRLACATAAMLFLLVLAAPWLDTGDGAPGLLALFAYDATVRRTTLASAVGLLVTACVFFRPPGQVPPPRRRPPSDVAGA